MNRGNEAQARYLREDLDALRDDVGSVESWRESVVDDRPRWTIRCDGDDLGPWSLSYAAAFVKGLVYAARIDGWSPPRSRAS